MARAMNHQYVNKGRVLKKDSIHPAPMKNSTLRDRPVAKWRDLI
jgi:hypothetical protein